MAKAVAARKTKTINGKARKTPAQAVRVKKPVVMKAGALSAATAAADARRALRTTLRIQGAREHNLQNITLEIPRDQLTVVTGLSGSGKSSLAFDTIYAEGQRRYMESLSSFAKRFVAQIKKPDVDYMFGLSPVISIEQKTTGRNPRSTVGTMTDIASYLNLLFATSSVPHCPYCAAVIPARTKNQLLDQLLALPAGTTVEFRAPVFPIHGEKLSFLFTEVRKKGYRRMFIDGKAVDISDGTDEDETADGGDYGAEMEAVVDKLKIGPGMEKQLQTAIANTLLLGENFIRIVLPGAPKAVSDAFFADYGCPQHRLCVADLGPEFFMFNNPQAACRTCSGLGTYMQVHPDLLVPFPEKSIREGCFSHAFSYKPDNYGGWIVYSVAKQYGFSLDVPFNTLPEKARQILFYGTGGTKFPFSQPPESRNKSLPRHVGKMWGFDGIARWIERAYKRFRQGHTTWGGMEDWLGKVMVEHTCPGCHGARLRTNRLRFTLNGKNLNQIGDINFAELRAFLDTVKITGRQRGAGEQVLKEIKSRLDLLLGIGLDYLNFNRRSSTLSGGESQRIRLSTQIGSGLMGMLYVLDEPSIGLHPKDNQKMIATLRRLRDLGNTVIVVEHDEDTIRAADHVVEMGPGPGVHGGKVVVSGNLVDVLACRESPTGTYLSGRAEIVTPNVRRAASGRCITIRGARENNLKNLDVPIPLQQFVCITGASGSGKSSLVSEILYKALHKHFHDFRTLPGAHDAIDGLDQITGVVDIDQSPIGRSSRSNPATYIGFYDDIRALFARTPEAKKRGYKPGRFSFNVKGGRCPECQGEGTVRTQLYFMPDVEHPCEACKGARYNAETLEITYKDKTIADVLDMPIEAGVLFFEDVPAIARKIAVLDELGLGYLTLGQSSTTLSGGEAQRIKLANELSKMKKGDHTLYILDEPTTGLHLADIARLLDCLGRLVDAGHTVLVIEHHLDVIKTADWIIDLGPEGGHSGGELIAQGTPEDLCRAKNSYTGQYLRAHMGYLDHQRSTTGA